MNKMLIIDANNLAFANFYTFSDLSFEERQTGVIFGFLKQVLFLADKFNSSNFYFCWDSDKSYRKHIYPEYKANRRKDLTEEETINLQLAFKQFDELRTKVLPRIGFGNIFRQNGYEADDLIADIVLRWGRFKKLKLIVVSTDKDLYQLLGKCKIYNQKTKDIITKKDFIEKYDISCRKWVKTKALMGDSSDNIQGINGVGQTYALRYIKGELKKGKILDKILSKESKQIVRRNIKLIKLPYKGRKKIETVLSNNKFDKDKFIDVFVDYGFESFLRHKNLEKWVSAFT